jgi:DNA replication licensing factor MCM7
LDELVAWDGVRGMALAQEATTNTMRYVEIFSRVVDKKLEAIQRSATAHQSNPATMRDSMDVLQEQRLAQQAARQAAEQTAQEDEPDGGIMNDVAVQANGATVEFPPVLMRRYELRILPRGRTGSFPPFTKQQKASIHDTGRNPEKDKLYSLNGVSLRHVRSQSMGKLVTISGMIVRASDVKPCCVVATYSCDACGSEIYQVVQSKREFLPLRICPSPQCREQGGNKDSLHLQTRGSKFEKFQELKIQELPNQVPMGHIPRSMSVHCRGELTRVATPGDVVTIDGVFLPQRISEGYAALKAGLISSTFLEAQNIQVSKKSYDDSIANTLSEGERIKLDQSIMGIATGEDPIGKLSSSIAPEIFGHEDIKRALLLQLVGGCTRKLPDGMKIRGDINICLMGDPGVAKSQLLKHVSSIAPRGVYTTGKGSSGVGLTAAITKDTTTGELALEGGALVLADQGVCAIDEFDKMDESDRTAIHEVMEQQTVSVAKAGIVATLNARAAVLAAANPLYGRYNRKKSMSENVNLPNSLLSRFDLMFLILDIADVDRDMALARHVTFVHQNEGISSKEGQKQSNQSIDNNDDEMENIDDEDIDEEIQEKSLPPKLVREYISRARKFQPVVPPEVAPYVVEAYVGLRMQGNQGILPRGVMANDQTAMTVRQLLSILRLGQALARLRFSDYVAREDVDEAIRLTHMSKATLNEDSSTPGQENNQGNLSQNQDITSRIYHIMKDYVTASRAKSIEVKLCEAMVLRKGFTTQQLQTCIEDYQELNVIQLNRTRTHIQFL